MNLLKLLSLCEPNTKNLLSFLLRTHKLYFISLLPAEVKEHHSVPKWSSVAHSFVLKVPITQKDHLWKDLCRRKDQHYWKEQKGVTFGAVICLDGRKSRKVGHWASRSVKHRWHHSYTISAPLLIKQPLCAADNFSNWCQHTGVTG